MRLSAINKRLAQKIGYERKLDTSKEIIYLNVIVAEGVAEAIKEDLPPTTSFVPQIRRS